MYRVNYRVYWNANIGTLLIQEDKSGLKKGIERIIEAETSFLQDKIKNSHLFREKVDFCSIVSKKIVILHGIFAKWKK